LCRVELSQIFLLPEKIREAFLTKRIGESGNLRRGPRQGDLIWEEGLGPLGNWPSLLAGNSSHTANGIYDKGMSNQLQRVIIAGAIPIGITAAQVQIVTGGQSLHMPAFPFAIGQWGKDISRKQSSLSFQPGAKHQ
jgi:hypothetical protein